MLKKSLEIIGKPVYLLLKTLILTISYLQKLISLTPSLIKLPKKIKKKTKKLSKKKVHLTFSIKFFTILGAITFFSAFFYFIILKDLPSPKELQTRHRPLTTQIFDRNGKLLYKIFKDENRSLISLSDLNQHTIDATIAIEDQDFYQHTGVSLRGITRALQRNILENKIQGGSTITQQLVKNALLSSEQTLIRKVKEAILAVAVELTYSKDQILEMYFNEVGYGGANYGIKEASNYYFGKPPNNLTLSESALLAGLPKAPTTYSPFGANPELSLIRQHEVLRRMVEDGYITNQESDQAKSQKITLISPSNNILAPHFIMYTKDLLVSKYGESLVHQGGLNVTTTLDLDLQTFAKNTLIDELNNLKHLNVNNGAILITNPQNGDILAMVGSVDYFDIENDGQVNVTNRPRQPGSAIKPITYSLAFENNFSPSSTILDSPITYRVPGSPPYSPKNYDNSFHGQISLRSALANSYNVPAVKLLSHLGVNNLIDAATNMGISTWNDKNRYGLSLTLGGAEVTMIDLATAYSSFSNLGTKTSPYPFISIVDQKQNLILINECVNNQTLNLNKKLEQYKCQQQQVISPITAFQITDILSDNRARSRTFGLYSKLNIKDQQVAVKTGTTNNLRDNWTIGYTSDYLVAVWVGNNDNSPMSQVASGITGATPIWNKIMTHILEDSLPHVFTAPEDIVKISICTLTQTLPCKECPYINTEVYKKGEEPKNYCNQDMIDKILTPKTDSLPRDQILTGATTQ